MKRSSSQGRRATAGFTLIELLVVMSIIAILISMLLPAINAAVILSRVFRTQSLINGLDSGIVAFRNDWGVYPPSNIKGFPSDHSVPTAVTGGTQQAFGFNCLAYSLCGPTGAGSGANAGTGNVSNLPLTPGTTNLSYKAYFVPESGGSITDTPDGFGSPTRYIFYYRYEVAANGGPTFPSNLAPAVGYYNINDNPTTVGTNMPPAEGFSSSNNGQQFLLLATYAGANSKHFWRRQDYMLISPGADRLYGHVVVSGSGFIPAMGPGDNQIDDVCNFNYKN